MAQRLLLALMVLWCVGALGWFLLHDGGDEAQRALDDPAPSAEERVPAGPSLAARPPSVDSGTASPLSDADEIPDWILLITALHTLDERARFLAWLREDPSRILAFLRSVMSQQGRFASTIPAPRLKTAGLHVFFLTKGLRRFFRPLAGQLGFLLPTLKGALRVPGASRGMVASVLAVLSTIEPPEGEGYEEVMTLIVDGDASLGIRVLAADTLLQRLGPTPEVLQSLASILRMPLADYALRMEYVQLMVSIRKLGERGASLAPALLRMAPGARRMWGLDVELTKALVAIAPGDPGVQRHMVGCLQVGSPSVRKLARDLLLSDAEPGHRTLLSLLMEADGRGRVAGINALLQAGHPPEELAPLLMPALTDPSPDVRRKAVSLLGKVGRDVHEILPALRELLAAEQQDRWLTGVRALGALSTVAGDRDTVLQLLFVAVRLPNSRVRKVAVQSLLMFDEHTERIIPLLADLLNDSESDVRREAVDGLGELSAHDEGAEAHLRRALGDSDESVRALAQYWLSEDEDSDD